VDGPARVDEFRAAGDTRGPVGFRHRDHSPLAVVSELSLVTLSCRLTVGFRAGCPERLDSIIAVIEGPEVVERRAAHGRTAVASGADSDRPPLIDSGDRLWTAPELCGPPFQSRYTHSRVPQPT